MPINALPGNANHRTTWRHYVCCFMLMGIDTQAQWWPLLSNEKQHKRQGGKAAGAAPAQGQSLVLSNPDARSSHVDGGLPALALQNSPSVDSLPSLPANAAAHTH